MTNSADVSEKKPRRARAFLRGCAVGCLTFLVLFGLAAYGAYRMVRGRYPSLTDRLRAQGYDVVRRQFIDVADPIETRTVFVGQQVRITAGSQRGIAILAQTAEIHGVVEGNVYFWGQQITLGPGAELKHHLHVLTDRVVNRGHLRGEVRGYYREWVGPGGSNTADNAPRKG